MCRASLYLTQPCDHRCQIIIYDLSPVWISLATSIVATAITLVLGIAAASWRERHSGSAYAIFDGVALLPLVLPPTVVGFLLLLLFGRHGPLGKFLLHAGMRLVFTRSATVVAAAVGSGSLMSGAAGVARG